MSFSKNVKFVQNIKDSSVFISEISTNIILNIGLMDVGFWYFDNIDFETFDIYLHVHVYYHDEHHIPDEESSPPSCKTSGNDSWILKFGIRVSFGCNFWCKRNAFVQSPLLFFCETVNLYTGHLFKVLLQLNFRFR